MTLEAFVAEIEAHLRRRPDMAPVRAFNHQMVDLLDRLRPLQGRALLDAATAPQGYALERALARGVSMFVGVGTAVTDVQVAAPGRIGTLVRMDATDLRFPAGSFDLVLCLSAFEHFQDGGAVLREMHRVLRPGGSALVSFEPVWTASYGHHLHHVPEAGRLIPPWAHLLWDPDRMRGALGGRWPAGSPVSLEDAVSWIFASDRINRLPLETQRRLFRDSPLEIEWMVPIVEEDPSGRKALLADYLAGVLPWSAEDLLTRGLSLLLNRR